MIGFYNINLNYLKHLYIFIHYIIPVYSFERLYIGQQVSKRATDLPMIFTKKP